MFSFTLNGHFWVTKNVEFPLSVRLLVDLAPFSRRSNRIEDTSVSNSGFHILGDQLVPIAGQADTWVFGFALRRVSDYSTGAMELDSIADD